MPLSVLPMIANETHIAHCPPGLEEPWRVTPRSGARLFYHGERRGAIHPTAWSTAAHTDRTFNVGFHLLHNVLNKAQRCKGAQKSQWPSHCDLLDFWEPWFQSITHPSMPIWRATFTSTCRVCGTLRRRRSRNKLKRTTFSRSMRRLVNWVWFVPVPSGVLLWQALPIRQFLLTNLVRSSFGDHFRLRIPLKTLALSLDKMGDFPFKDPYEAHYDGQTLIVRGTKSHYVADDVLPLVGRFFPIFKLIDIDSGHWVISEKPEAFRQGTTRCSFNRSQCWCASRRGLLAGGRGKRNVMSLARINKFAAPKLRCKYSTTIFVDRQHELRGSASSRAARLKYSHYLRHLSVMGQRLKTPCRPASNIKGGARLAICNQHQLIQSGV